MRAVVQRTSSAEVKIDGNSVGKIDKGFLVLLGVTHSDTEKDVEWLANKIKGLRVFEDAITFKIALMVVQYMKYMETLDY